MAAVRSAKARRLAASSSAGSGVRLFLRAVLFLLLIFPLEGRAQVGQVALAVTSGAASSCPDNDGSSGATAGSANYPSLLSGYAATIDGTHGLGCKVAGVDYRIGLVASPSLADPTLGGLPSGTTVSGSTVTVGSNNTTITGWDFSLHGGLQLLVSSGVSGTVITGNKFAIQTPNCLVAMFFTQLAGTTTVTYNNIDGGGAACPTLTDSFSADVYIESAASGASFIFNYNLHTNIGQDGLNIVGPSSGTGLALTHKYNVLYQQGWNGHPDGTQFAGGIVAAPVISHNTYYNFVFSGGEAGTQPFHVEAQLTAAITNAVVAYNTMVTTGTCDGGSSYPTGCSVNYDIACKQDTGSNTNTGFSAYANYVDWSGAIAALTNAYSCTSTSWGTPFANYDMVAGTTLPTP